MNAQDRSLTPLSVDIERVICDTNRLFNPLHKDFMLDYQVQAYRDGYVLLTIALPEGMTKVFSSMLESMSGFFHFMHIKSKTVKASALATDPAEIARREKLQGEFKNDTCKLFDGFIGQGMSTKEAVRLTNLALKEQNHPWANLFAPFALQVVFGRVSWFGWGWCRNCPQVHRPPVSAARRERSANR